jgi:hypothetical protein
MTVLVIATIIIIAYWAVTGGFEQIPVPIIE